MKFKEKSQGLGKNFLRLKAGDSIRGVFRGDPYDFKQHWIDNRSMVCPGKEACEACKAGQKPSFRFRLNLVVSENGAHVAKIFEQGWTVYEALRALHEGDYDLERHLMKITRHGQGTETTYSIIPVPNGVLNKEQEAAVLKVPLNPLEHGNQEPVEAEEEETAPF